MRGFTLERALLPIGNIRNSFPIEFAIVRACLTFIMENRLSHGHEHYVYTRDEDIPFIGDGSETGIGDGVVTRVVKRPWSSFPNLLYARKSLLVNAQDTQAREAAKRKILREARIMDHARHGHVVNLIMSYFLECGQETRFAMIMERADGNLSGYLNGTMSRNRLCHFSRWFGCLIGVVAYIHSLGIRHRDIKPTNILIKNKQILLADFGISKMGLGKTMPTTVPVIGTGRGRTARYCAPEVEDGGTRGRSADIFSLGAVFLEMLIAHSYETKGPYLQDILQSQGQSSYAKNIDLVHQFMDDIEQECGPHQWFLKVLCHCRHMLQIERDQRPLAEELSLAWSSLLPSDQPLKPCNCPGLVPPTESNKLIELCKRNSLEEVEAFLTNGADRNTVGAIHQASTRGFTRIVQCFLNHNVNVNLRDYCGQTPLHCAAGYGREGVVELLIGDGADVNLEDEVGQMALHCAAAQGSQIIIRLLLSKGADIQARDGEGQTALHFAAKRGHDEVIRILLDEKADAAVRNDKGQTALHFAAGYGSTEVVTRLLTVLDNDAIDAQDVNGQTALHFAARGKRSGGRYKGVIGLLKKYRSNLTSDDHRRQSI